MRRRQLLGPVLFLLASNVGLAAKPLADRAPKVVLRTTKIGYCKLGCAVQALQDNKHLGRYSNTLAYGDGSGVSFAGDFVHAMATFGSRAAFVAQNPGRGGDAAYYEGRIREVDAMLDELPDEVTQGFRFGSVYGNQWLQKSAYRQLTQKMVDMRKRLRTHEQAKIDAIATRITELETHLQGGLDATDAAQARRVAERLQTLPTERLYEHAIDLIGQIDDMAQGKEIRREQVERGQSQSSFSGGSSASATAVTLGRRGQLTGAAWSDESSHISGSSSSSYSRDQLLLQASKYTARIRNTKGRQSDQKALTPVEGRVLARMILDVQQVARALNKRDPARAAILNDWVEHTEVVFDSPSGAHTVQIGHATRDVAGLAPMGIVTQKFAASLQSDATKPITDRLGGGNALLDD